ncbi:MAG: phosphoribosyl-ATP diphosphatase [Candidatus Obscuribacterales bacterium]
MIVPSIDIIGGKAVQLRQGKEFVLESERDPVDLAREFNRYGEVAVIDLDSAMGKGNNRELIERICKVADARVGGGIRDVETGRALLRAGAKSLIVGTKATPEFLSQFPADRIIVALDHVNEEVVDKGWTNSTGESIWERASRLEPYCSGFLVTFVEAEGGLGGLPASAAAGLLEKLKKHVTVAGGIASTSEVSDISALGADVQVGMALYKGLVDPVEAVVQSVNFDTNGTGVVPTVVQDMNGQVLMLAYSSPESLRRALKEGKGIYYSRSRQEIWEKGLTSGATQQLVSCRVDCDRDSLLFRIEQTEGACHRGSYSCFGQATSARQFSVGQLFSILQQRKQEMPEGSYSVKLFKDRRKLLKKLMEEAHEVCTFESTENLRWEIADLIYFASLLAVDEGVSWADIECELGGRAK